MKKNTIIALASTATVVGLVGISLGISSAFTTQEVKQTEVTSKSVTAPTQEETIEATPPVTTQSTDDLLLYLIEEEKLAHDVYTVLYNTWGTNVFSNITASETQHQTQVATLLSTYGLTDPRSSELGVFTNPELQSLYDQLIAKGMQSQKDAIEVGVIIEETDISDLSEAISSTTDSVIIQTLESLRAASENHLSAFQRQL